MLDSEITYNIYTAGNREFDGLVEELLKNCFQDEGTIIQLTFFGSPSGNEEYLEQLNIIREKTKNIFGDNSPMISYVAQKPLVGELVLEVGRLLNFGGTIAYKVLKGKHYLELNDKNYKSLIINIISDNIRDSIKKQSEEVFTCLENILNTEGYNINSIVRQWNYIERITDFEGEHQHYQSFNDARSHFYAKTEWDNGYPAATGIGTQFGGIMVSVVAVIPENKNYRCIPLNNELQVAAYAYSQNVLVGAEDEAFQKKSTPKFERAKAVLNERQGVVYISGTAAIRGENSLNGVGIEEQTRITLENINYLISQENLVKAGINTDNNCSIDMLRIYLKYEEDMQVVKKHMDTSVPAIPISYLLADVCREELLIEIEGIASFSIS